MNKTIFILLVILIIFINNHNNLIINCCKLYNGKGGICNKRKLSTRICCNQNENLMCNAKGKKKNGKCVEVNSFLFLGNSFTIRNNLVGMFNRLSASGKVGKVIVKSSLKGSTNLNYHSKNPNTYKQLNSRNSWKGIVLQEQSLHLQNGDYYTYDRVYPYALTLANEARIKNGKTYLFETWAYSYGSGYSNDNFYDMQNRIIDGYDKLANYLTSYGIDVVKIPVGTAFKLATDYFNNPYKTLYFLDGRHPSEAGSYLAALTIYAKIYNKSPIGNKYKPKKINANLAKLLKKFAHQAVFGEDSLNDG